MNKMYEEGGLATDGMDVDPMSPVQQPMDVDVQIGYGETPYTILCPASARYTLRYIYALAYYYINLAIDLS